MGQGFLPQGAAPSTPATGYNTIYVKTDKVLYMKDDTGLETPLSSQTTAPQKSPDIDVTASAGSLTVALNQAIYQDFHSSTASDGTPTTVLCDPVDFVIPGTATLGGTSGVAADSTILFLNIGGGVTEFAVSNLAGGVNLDESGVISTTAIGATSDSAGVVYSAIARTNVPYKVVKRFMAVNTADSWANPVSVNDDLKYKMLTIPAVATTSGTAIDFTGIPTWYARITVMFNGNSTNGTSHYLVQLGDSGGIENTGYDSYSNSFDSSAQATSSSTNGMIIFNGAAAASIKGNMRIYKSSGNTFIEDGTFSNGIGGQNFSAGSKTLSGTLDRIRITTVNGTDTFDGGSVSLIIEGY